MPTEHHDAIDARSGQAIRLTSTDGRIDSLIPLLAGDPNLPWLLPPLFDLQVNGYAGVDFQRDDATAAELERAVGGLAAAACHRILLTLITDQWDRLLARLRRYRELRSASPRLRRRIAGWHIEGPFLSARPGFHGAHPPEHMIEPTPERMRELRAAAGDDLVLVTLAAEWPGAPAAIAAARALGFRVWLGHTDASAAQLAAAVAAGADGFTHLGNGCPAEWNRHDNIVFRVLDEPGLRVSLIPDRIHVSPMLFRLVHRALGDARICLTTDAMAAGGGGPGSYRIAGMTVEVGADGVVRQPGRTNYAGSSLAPLEGVRRAAAMLDRPLRQVWPLFSSQPAAFVGLPPSLAPGAPADFCLLHETPPENRLEIHLAGEQVREARWSS